jgi:hypothetical protein
MSRTGGGAGRWRWDGRDPLSRQFRFRAGDRSAEVVFVEFYPDKADFQAHRGDRRAVEARNGSITSPR